MKLRQDSASVIRIAPVWHGQYCFPEPVRLSIQPAITVPLTPNLILQNGIFIILTSLKDSIKYINLSTEEAGASVPETHQYEVKNLRQRSVPLSVTFQFPVELSGVRVWDASEVVPSKPQLAQCVSEAGTPGSKDFVKRMSKRPLLTQQQKVSLVSEARIEYEEQKYTQKEGFVQRQFGFFQRQYKQMMEDAVEGEGAGPTRSATAGNPPASDAPKQ
ncbi:integrin alpha-X-like isoform X3 [Eretmochelys imbricata]